MGKGLAVIEKLAREERLFRARDVRKRGASTGTFRDARVYGVAKPRGHGVWSHPDYVPTRYELLQIRFEHAVFCGPSALWLHGQLKREPEALWITIANKARMPRTLELDTVIIRTRNLEQDVVRLRPPGYARALRVHTLERAQADVAANDSAGLLERAITPRDFVLAEEGELLPPLPRPIPWLPFASLVTQPQVEESSRQDEPRGHIGPDAAEYAAPVSAIHPDREYDDPDQDEEQWFVVRSLPRSLLAPGRREPGHRVKKSRW